MVHAEHKADRLLKIEALLLAHPDGLSQAELARRLGVDRSTIHRDLPDLPRHIYVETDGRWKIDRAAYLVNVRLTLDEAMALHLATRLQATRIDRQNPHAAAALRKLGVSLEKLAPRISGHMLLSADQMDDPRTQRQDPVYLAALERLTLAWAEQQCVHVWHRHENGNIYEYDFAPYFIEPYAVGQTTHVIGLRRPPGAVRTFKIERLERVELLRESYELPPDINPQSFLRSAWGIWFTEGEPVRVVLQFSSRVARRVKETRWHPTQELQDLPSGGLRWQADVAETQEMLPWIRGWGADVEVIEPEDLRKQILDEIRKLNKTYRMEKQPQEPQLVRLLKLWGKTSRSNDEQFHPALYHMLDSGNVARELLGDQASPRWRAIMGQQFGVDPSTLVGWLPYLVALHDIGKISAPFQAQNEFQCARLVRDGFDLGRKSDLRHTKTGMAVLGSEFADSLSLSEGLRRVWRDACGGHHGQFIPPGELKNIRTELRMVEPSGWTELRQTAEDLLKMELFSHQPQVWQDPSNLSAATMALAGFTILCDWLSSDEGAFPFESEMDYQEYSAISRLRAKDAVRAAGFFKVPHSHSPIEFQKLYTGLVAPRPLQLAMDDIPTEALAYPCLAVIEAPTGEGKTEAALALAHRIATIGGTDEFYFALPTMATSNQMYLRVQRYLRDQLGLDAAVRLVHGQAWLVEDDLQLEVTGESARHAGEWFGPKKRALLAPFGVGTVDQVELGALNVRHNALRLVGLAGKTLILDEVHAYDVYMNTIVEQLLKWLAALGTSVVLLSATLPQARREGLMRAYGIPKAKMEGQSGYPGVWVGNANYSWHANPAAAQPQRVIELHQLHFNDNEAVQKADWLLAAVKEGGCAAWIANTVDRAQLIYQALRERAPKGVDLVLLHARFPLARRMEIEQELMAKYGPGGQNRPGCGIVVGTQVLEQSLDLDFDVMATDIAPVDLLLQRTGRLFRHARFSRPPSHDRPHLWVNTVLDDQGEFQPGVDGIIYSEYLLLRTLESLGGHAELHLPADYRLLVERVYDPTPPTKGSSLEKPHHKLLTENTNAMGEAKLRLLPDPDPVMSFCSAAGMQFEEDENRAAWIVAQTRLTEDTVTVVPLVRQGQGAKLWGTEQFIDLAKPAAREVQLAMMRSNIRVGQRDAVKALRAQEIPVVLKESSMLKGVLPLWLEGDIARLKTHAGEVILKLDPDLGLIMVKKGGS